MRLGFTAEQEDFRRQCAAWLRGHMVGEFSDIRGISNLLAAPDRRREWEQRLAEYRWSCIGWPEQWGGRDASLAEQVIFAEEYARAGAPNRLNHVGVELIGPTILAFGTEAQKQRFLPGIALGRDIWCQGYSEPGAGSDLASLRTRAWRDGDMWVVEGQKVWTSLAQFADHIFVLARSEAGSRGRQGLSFLLLPMDQPGIEVRPIRQINGEAEFNEVFFSAARGGSDALLGPEGDGWRVSTFLLGLERGVSTLAQQMQFRNERDAIIGHA
jgi:alkylation response protein AidB-like acyl-CoA dehydrogenase